MTLSMPWCHALYRVFPCSLVVMTCFVDDVFCFIVYPVLVDYRHRTTCAMLEEAHIG